MVASRASLVAGQAPPTRKLRLGRKVGPLPLWAWAELAAIGLSLGYHRREHRAAAAVKERALVPAGPAAPTTADAVGHGRSGAERRLIDATTAARSGEPSAAVELHENLADTGATGTHFNHSPGQTMAVPLPLAQTSVQSTAALRSRGTPAAEFPTAVAAFGLARVTAIVALAGTVLLELQAMLNGYGLRVTSDTPTYLALLRDVSLHPLAPVSPFLRVGGVETSHATPDMEALGLLWRQISPDPSLVSPVHAYHLLAAWGIVVTLLVAHALWVWVRGLAGNRAAWISIPVLLGLFGPANVIWAGDLSFHGFLYGSYFSQTFAVALLLYALHWVPRAASRPGQAAVVALVTLLLLVHPFTGVLFVFLITCQAMAWGWQRRAGWRRAPWTVGLAFLLGSTWPAYSLSAAMTVAGLSGLIIVAIAVLAPGAAYHAVTVMRLVRRAGAPFHTPSLRIRPMPIVTVLAVAGLVVVCLVAGWEEWLATRPITDPLRPANHLAIYWNDRLVRWPLMFGAGLVGLSGLRRLVRSGSGLPAFWCCVCFGIGLAGAAGVPIPLWNRLLLFCQLPLAAGTAVALTRARLPTRSIVVAGFAVSATVRLLLLYYAPANISYYPATWLPAGYALGQQIHPGLPGLVAADPYASYYVPAATGHAVLLISKSHVGSDSELNAATVGYTLLHQLYVGEHWQRATRELWRRGVRYVIVDHRVTVADSTLERFSNDQDPLWRTPLQRRELGRYFQRLNLLGHVIADTPQYVIYRLDKAKVRWEVGA